MKKSLIFLIQQSTIKSTFTYKKNVKILAVTVNKKIYLFVYS